jgi:hypothetical protein
MAIELGLYDLCPYVVDDVRVSLKLALSRYAVGTREKECNVLTV